MIDAGVKEGYFVLNTAGLRDWLTLPQKDDKTVGVKLPDEVDKVYKEIVDAIKASGHQQVFLSSVKHSLSKKYGGFDESVYGYSQFKEMMEEGESQKYFKLGVNDKQAYYAYLPKK